MSNPTKMVFLKDRRHIRSDNPLTAIKLQLAHAIDEFDLKTCLVATEDGRLFAAPNDLNHLDAEMLAALATQPWCDPRSSNTPQTLKVCGFVNAHIKVHEFWAFDQPLFLLTIHNTSTFNARCIHNTVRGIRRITRCALEPLSA